MSKNYFTQMEAARKGIVTEEMRRVAQKENRSIYTCFHKMEYADIAQVSFFHS